jgi:hypothetical protein
MKKIDLGQMVTVLANLGVLAGILVLVYELNQTRDLARIEFLANNDAVFQEIEREMMSPDVASIWAKAAINPASLSATEVRVLDAFLINLFNFWRQNWTLEQEGFQESGDTVTTLSVDAPFYFGNTFAQVWWEDLKSIHHTPEILEFDALIDNALTDISPTTNREYIERLQRRVEERLAGERQ